MVCPLCHYGNISLKIDDECKYFECNKCMLIFADKNAHLSFDEEFSRYKLHNNHTNDLGYRNFLLKLVNPMLNYVDFKRRGLDFGCGPSTLLSNIFKEKGIDVYNYDPFFYPQKELLDQKYDFITSSEVVEHFFYPSYDWSLMINILNDGGYLGIMTQLIPDNQEFYSWWYRKDPTHVSFYSKKTMKFIADKFHLKIIEQESSITIFKKYESRCI